MSYVRRYELADRDREQHLKSLPYLLDLEREGHIDGQLFGYLGIKYDVSYANDPLKAKMYYQRAIERGYIPPYALRSSSDADNETIEKALLILLEAESKGLDMKDDRIFHSVFEVLTLHTASYTPSSQVLGKFKDATEMALHYCDVLIQRRSPLGYSAKSDIYSFGIPGVSRDECKAMAILEEGARVGRCTHITCLDLLSWYR